MAKNRLIQTKVSEDLYTEIKERIRLGLYADESEVIQRALRKFFAEEAREYLRGLAKSAELKEKEMLEEWKKVRSEEKSLR